MLVVNLYLRNLSWPDVAVLLKSHCALQKHPKFAFFTKEKTNETVILV